MNFNMCHLSGEMEEMLRDNLTVTKFPMVERLFVPCPESCLRLEINLMTAVALDYFQVILNGMDSAY